MLHDILRPLDGHRLFLTFDDGASGTVDLNAMIRFDGVFAPLRDADYFALVRVDPEPGTVVWPNGADLCPDVLHARLTGQQLPGPNETSGAHAAAD
jgi:Protein of unknown function (DUF2442)